MCLLCCWCTLAAYAVDNDIVGMNDPLSMYSRELQWATYRKPWRLCLEPAGIYMYLFSHMHFLDFYCHGFHWEPFGECVRCSVCDSALHDVGTDELLGEVESCFCHTKEEIQSFPHHHASQQGNLRVCVFVCSHIQGRNSMQ